MDGIVISINPPITPGQLFAFYERNQICEVGFGPEVAARVLEHSALCVAAFRGEQLALRGRACAEMKARFRAFTGRDRGRSSRQAHSEDHVPFDHDGRGDRGADGCRM